MTPAQLGLFGDLRQEISKKTHKSDNRKWIRQVMWAFQAPRLNSPGGWCESAPPWMREYLMLDRLTHLIKGVRTDGLITTTSLLDTGYYLYGASMVAPLGNDWNDIICRVQGTLLKKWNPFNWDKGHMLEVLSDIMFWGGESLEELDGYKAGLLLNLRQSMFTRQMGHVAAIVRSSKIVGTAAESLLFEKPEDVSAVQEKLL